MGKKSSGGRSLKKKDLERMVIELFQENPTREFELKDIFRLLHLTTHPTKMVCMDVLEALQMDDYIKESNIDYWIFGHTHWNAKRGTKIGNTTLLTNQMGYLTHGGEKGFSLNEHVEI